LWCGALLKEGAGALHDLAARPKHLGDELGITALLQNWTRDLLYHPHVHLLVSGGGADGQSVALGAGEGHGVLSATGETGGAVQRPPQGVAPNRRPGTSDTCANMNGVRVGEWPAIVAVDRGEDRAKSWAGTWRCRGRAA